MEDKYVTIITSSNNNIDDYYKELASRVSNYLASSGFNLSFGGCSTSMMGITYNEFVKQNRKVNAYTTIKYQDDLNVLDKATGIVCETTFDLKKQLFENSDIIVVLPGGIGTYSEVLSFIEEKRSNDKNIPIEIYDEDGYFTPFFETLKLMQIKNFNDESISSLFNVSHNLEEFKIHIDEYLYNTKENTR